MRKLSRTIVCPECRGFATVVERTKDFRYKVRCPKDGEFLVNASEEKRARTEYTRRLKQVENSGLSNW
jgi:uncharacterized protein YbaR (Trm112 family)